jgi:ABC-type glycerol-3-phosphate transport system substrate-binding protein
MPRATRAVSRKDFLRLSGAGLAGAALLGTTGCGGGQGSGEVIKYLTETPETTNLERTAIEIQVNRFEEQNPKYTLERESIAPDDLHTVIKTRLQSGEPPTFSTTVLARASPAYCKTRDC